MQNQQNQQAAQDPDWVHPDCGSPAPPIKLQFRRRFRRITRISGGVSGRHNRFRPTKICGFVGLDGQPVYYLSEVPLALPDGFALVHDPGTPDGTTRRWIQRPNAYVIACLCPWAPGLGTHYRTLQG